jgi:hypothetical protein
MTRREFLSLTGGLVSARAVSAFAQQRAVSREPANITLQISEIDLELAPGHNVRTTA